PGRWSENTTRSGKQKWLPAVCRNLPVDARVPLTGTIAHGRPPKVLPIVQCRLHAGPGLGPLRFGFAEPEVTCHRLADVALLHPAVDAEEKMGIEPLGDFRIPGKARDQRFDDLNAGELDS